MSGPNDGTDLGSPRAHPYPMEALPLLLQRPAVSRRAGARRAEVVSEPVARNSRPYDGRPTCCGNNNCMPICPIGAMYNGIVHVDRAEAAGAGLIARPSSTDRGRGHRRIAAVHYFDANGASHRVTGKISSSPPTASRRRASSSTRGPSRQGRHRQCLRSGRPQPDGPSRAPASPSSPTRRCGRGAARWR